MVNVETGGQEVSSVSNLGSRRVSVSEMAVSAGKQDGERDSTSGMTPRQGGSEWCYDQNRSRADERDFLGHVELIHGASAQNLRTRLAHASADLLQWAADASSAEFAEDA